MTSVYSPLDLKPGDRFEALLLELERQREGHPEQGLALAEEVRRMARDGGRLDAEALGHYHAAVCAFRLSRLNLSEQHCDFAEALFRQQGDMHGLLQSTNLRAALAQERGDTGRAYQLFRQALGEARSAQYLPLQGRLLGNLAQCAQQLGDITTALRWTLEALTLARQEGLTEVEGRTLLMSSTLSLRLGHAARAAENANSALEIAERGHLPGLKVSALLTLAQVREDANQYAAFLETAQQALSLSQTPKDTLSSQLLISRALIELGREKEASNVLMEAMNYACDLGTEMQVSVLVEYGRAQMRCAHFYVARQQFVQAEALSRESEHPALLAGVLLAQSELEELAGRPQEALRAYKQYHELDRHLFGERQSQLAHGLVITHEVDEQRRLMAELRATNQELHFANRELHYAANHDALTGVLNRRAFMNALQSRLSAPLPPVPDSRRKNISAVAVALFDVDHFKHVNDSFGHDTGDAVLRGLTQVVKGRIRESDILSRWGGEEFILLLPSTDALGAANLCERLRSALEAHEWHSYAAGLRVTASFGFAVVDVPCPSQVETLLKEADAALYRAKNGGRNRVSGPAPHLSN